jgi:hypothetical protein
MSDCKALAREIAGRSKPRFIEIKPELRSKVSRPSSRRFVEIARERRSGDRGGADRHPWRAERKGISSSRDPEASKEMTTRRKPAQTKKPQRSETWETCKEFLNIHEAWMMEFEDGWYAYYGDEKPIGPFKTEHEATRAGLKHSA